MPIFSELKILFIHIPKNAGRSIEQALLGEAGTPDGGRRSFLNSTAHAILKLTASSFTKKYLIGTLDVVTVAQHLTYMEMDLLGLINKQQKADFMSVAVCRNPYDRAVSSLVHYQGEKQHKRSYIDNPVKFERSLKEWLETDINDHNVRAHRRQQVDYILDCRGETIVKNILRYENLNEEFIAFMRRAGTPKITLPWRGKSSRDRNYSDYFNDSSRKLIEQHFGDDLEYFKYTF